MDPDKYGYKQFEIERKSQICKIWKIWMARCHMMPASPPPNHAFSFKGKQTYPWHFVRNRLLY